LLPDQGESTDPDERADEASNEDRAPDETSNEDRAPDETSNEDRAPDEASNEDRAPDETSNEDRAPDEDSNEDSNEDSTPDESADAPAAGDDDTIAAPETAPLTRDDLRSRSGRLPVGPLVLGGLALLLVGFIVGRVTTDGDSTEEAAPSTTVARLEFPSGDQDRSGYWSFGGVTPAVSDTFSSGDTEDGLGQTDTGERWVVVTGAWRIDADLALAEPGGADPSLAVVPGGAEDRLTEATLTVVEEGAGIVFRFRDRDNYWAMTASPSVGIWTVTRVLDGQATVAAEVPGVTADGTTVTVAQRGAELQILVEGVEALRVTDEALQGQARSGLIAPADGDGTARFDRFYVGNMPA